MSYNASDFDATCRFYEKVLGCTRSHSWDREDGRGAYFRAPAAALVEIFGAARGAPPLAPPAHDSFALTLMVADAAAAHDAVIRAGATIDEAMVERPYGRFFGVRDPDGVLVYVMQPAAAV